MLSPPLAVLPEETDEPAAVLLAVLVAELLHAATAATSTPAPHIAITSRLLLVMTLSSGQA